MRETVHVAPLPEGGEVGMVEVESVEKWTAQNHIQRRNRLVQVIRRWHRSTD